MDWLQTTRYPNIRPPLFVFWTYQQPFLIQFEAPRNAMQFRYALDCILHENILASPAARPIFLNNTALSDGFYCICLVPNYVPKLIAVFPNFLGSDLFIAIPLVLAPTKFSVTLLLLHQVYLCEVWDPPCNCRHDHHCFLFSFLTWQQHWLCTYWCHSFRAHQYSTFTSVP